MNERSGKPNIRPALKEDASSIAEIYSESILMRDSTMVMDVVSPEDMRQKLAHLDERETVLVAETEGYLAGWGIVKYYSDRPGYRLACETSLFVRRSLTGKGIGSAIQERLMKSARNSGFHHVLVRIWTQNGHSIAMHEKFGFTTVGVQKEIGHVDGNWIDVTVMQCLLSETD